MESSCDPEGRMRADYMSRPSWPCIDQGIDLLSGHVEGELVLGCSPAMLVLEE